MIEVLRGVRAEKREEVKELLEESFDVIPLDNEVSLTYCNLYQDIRKEGTFLPDADLLIAATAIAHDLKLKGRDKHFKRLEKLGLKVG